MPKQIKRLVFWQPCVSPHTSDFLESLAQQNKNWDIINCAHENLLQDRIQLGWEEKNVQHYVQHVAPSKTQIRSIVETNPQHTIHVLCGIRWVPTIVRAIKEIKRVKTNFGIIQEPRVREGLLGECRFMQSWLTEHWFRKNASFVLGIGRNGPIWFKSVGYDKKIIFPFAYFILPPNPVSSAKRAKNLLKIGYVGRLIAMKGVEDILQALAHLNQPYECQIIGQGIDAEKFTALSQALKVNTLFHGVVPNHEIGALIAQFDVLILPSRSKDGWGVVVSEALLQGTAVIATEKVGASILLDDPRNGFIVKDHAPNEIAQAIQTLAEQGAFSAKSRSLRQELANQTLSAKAGAEYFSKIMAHCFADKSRPSPFYENKEKIDENTASHSLS